MDVSLLHARTLWTNPAADRCDLRVLLVLATTSGSIRLHFENTDADECSSLGGRRRDQRLADLAALFARVKLAEPGDVSVVGASWLYNLEAYRRLFPKSYVASTRVLLGRFQHMPLWGQFLNRHGAVKEGAGRVPLERLGRLSSLEDLDACFPLPVLAVEASAREFYEFYGVGFQGP